MKYGKTLIKKAYKKIVQRLESTLLINQQNPTRIVLVIKSDDIESESFNDENIFYLLEFQNFCYLL